MRFSPRLTAVLCTALGSSLLLAGCASSDEPTAVDESPLSEYFSSAYGGELSMEEQEERYRQDQREREDLIAQCMSEEGFEYLPNVQNMSFGSSGVEWEPDSREWVSQYGYGMVNFPGRDEPVQEEDQYVDANADYLESLSDSEREAFQEALNGPMPDEEAMMSEEPMEWDWTTAGCYGWAENERGVEDPFASDEHAPLMEAINELYENTTNSPEYQEIDAAWASCMADAGHPGFSAQYDAQNSIGEASNALYEENPDGMPDETKMAEIGDQEIELALVDLDCREETDYRDRQQDLQIASEQQFVDDHKDQLEAFKADAEQGR